MVPLSRRTVLRGGIVAGSTALVGHALPVPRSRSTEVRYRLTERLRGPLPATYEERLNEELAVISERGWWSSLDAVLVVTEAARRHRVFVHHDVGSWTSSLVAFGLGLTVLDPVGRQLPFERVMHSPGAPYLALAISPLAPLDFVSEVEAVVPGTTLELRTYGRDVGTALVRFPGPHGRHQVHLVRYVDLDEVQRAVGQGFDVEHVDLTAPVRVWSPSAPFDGDAAWVLEGLATFEDLTQALVLARLRDYSWIGDDVQFALWMAFLLGGAESPPSCEAYVAHTRGLLLFQEQLTSMVRDFTGLPFSEAHALRRVLGTGRDERIAPWRECFVAEAQRHATMAAREAEDVFDWLRRSYPISLSRTAAVAQAALWRWRAESRRFSGQK
jgi:hypothetical protein